MLRCWDHKCISEKTMQNILNVSVLAFNFKAVFLQKNLLQKYKLYKICGNINDKNWDCILSRQIDTSIVNDTICVCIFLCYENFFNYQKKFETCLYLIEAWNCGYKNTKISLRILSAFCIILWLQQLFMDCSDFFATA